MDGICLKNFGPAPRGGSYAVFDANRDPGATAIPFFSLLVTAANLAWLLPMRKGNV